MYPYSRALKSVNIGIDLQGDHKKLLQTAVQINKVRINFFDIFQRILLG